MSDEKTYTIAQLEWKGRSADNWRSRSPVSGRFDYFVWKPRDKWRWACGNTTTPCTDLEDGKRQCQEHFEAQMRKGLIARKEATA
ncbi:MAG: hypothetical protein V3U60_16115 [Gammaproteobacteria bacterium]